MMSELLRKRSLIPGKDPTGCAASILYLASKDTDEIRCQKDMAGAAGVTGLTIYNNRSIVLY
jgi:transcription initiation factor TFIIIB Brf1 subunit/transcription initiation factor TFIIB